MGEVAKAVVSRGGRPDLAGVEELTRVKVPTLLLVGGRDTPVIALNRDAYAKLRCEKQLRVIPGAGHLFDEPGTIEQLLARGAADPTEQHRYPVVALGSPWVISDGRGFPYLDRNGGERDLDLHWGLLSQWSNTFRFLAVRS